MSSPHFEPRRELGRTGFVATRVGIGDLADRSLARDMLVATLHRAMDYGLNVIDTAPGYEAGYSEEVVGAALAGGRRERMFVIDKVDHPTEPVVRQVDESLVRLRLDHVDLFVFHALCAPEVWEHVTTPGRGFDELEVCRKAGKLRFRGISSHDPAVLRGAVESGLCDVVVFPVGACVDARFVHEVLPLARQHGVGTVCFKTFGAGKLLGDTTGYNQPLVVRPRGKLGSGGTAGGIGGAREGDDAGATAGGADGGPRLPRLTVAECVRYTLTRDPDVALLGMSYPNELDAAVAVAAEFAPYSAAELAEVERRATEAVVGKGVCHWNPVAGR
jgi:aryl-alcohol dehydrogenase-like predicted oxidoreductase